MHIFKRRGQMFLTFFELVKLTNPSLKAPDLKYWPSKSGCRLCSYYVILRLFRYMTIVQMKAESTEHKSCPVFVGFNRFKEKSNVQTRILCKCTLVYTQQASEFSLQQRQSVICFNTDRSKSFLNPPTGLVIEIFPRL